MRTNTNSQQVKDRKYSETSKSADSTAKKENKFLRNRARLSYNDRIVIAILIHHLQGNPYFPNHQRLSKKIRNWSKCGQHLRIGADGRCTNKYCDNKTCSICSNIRTYDNEKHYGKILDQIIRDPERPAYMITLTTKNSTRQTLEADIEKHKDHNSRFPSNYNSRKNNKAIGETYNGKAVLEFTYKTGVKRTEIHVHTHKIRQALLTKDGQIDIRVYKPKEGDNNFEFEAVYRYNKKEKLTTFVNGTPVHHTFRAEYGDKYDPKKDKAYKACNVYYTDAEIDEWLKRNPDASIKGQNIKRAYSKDDLIKYTSKNISADRNNKMSGAKVDPKALLIIMSALDGLTTSFVYGTVQNRKNKNETQNGKGQGQVGDKLHVEGQITDLKPGIYSQIMSDEGVKFLLTEEHQYLTDLEDKPLLDSEGKQMYIKIKRNEIVETWLPNQKESRRCYNLQKNYFLTINNLKHRT